MQITLVEITVGVTASTQSVIRLASGRGYNHPTAPGQYDGDLGLTAWFEQRVVADGGTLLSSEVNAGQVTFANTGKYDTLSTAGFGHNCRILMGDDESEYGEFVEVFSGFAESMSASRTEITVKLRSQEYELAKPFRTATFAGTNDGSTIYTEGAATDIKGRLKPTYVGYAFNLTPVCVNNGQQIYGYRFKRDGTFAATATVGDLKDGGSLFTRDSDVVDLSALIASAPASGHVVHCPSLSLFRVGSKANFAFTLDASAAETAIKDVLPAILKDAGVPDSRIGYASIAALGSLGNYIVGKAVQDESVTALDLCAMMLSSVNAALLPDENNVYQVVRLATPESEPLLTLREMNGVNAGGVDACDLIDLALAAPTDRLRGMPCSKLTLKYAPNATIQQGGQLAASLASDVRERYGQDFLRLVKERASVLTQFPAAQPVEVETYLKDAANAEVMLNFFENYYGTATQVFQVTAKVTPAQARIWRCGATIRIEDPRWGNAVGKNYVTLSRICDPSSGLMQATIRG